jgi:hypothetical protein
MDDQPSQRAQYWDPEIYLSDMEILDAALQHDLPIFVSIDGSLMMKGWHVLLSVSSHPI